MDISSLTFNQSIGIRADGMDIVLCPRREHLNHVGTLHAAVVYGVAEAAAGQCLL
jgi:acyl-coenzyme A thioesterase PaaI-like protein